MCQKNACFFVYLDSAPYYFGFLHLFKRIFFMQVSILGSVYTKRHFYLVQCITQKEQAVLFLYALISIRFL